MEKITQMRSFIICTLHLTLRCLNEVGWDRQGMLFKYGDGKSHIIFARKPQTKISFERPRCREEVNIKMDSEKQCVMM
jgi:hypothetical protein